jgi:two-component system OmpR family sensor kinase
MLESMRARLTLWYTGVLALVLITFAFATYTYLARAARERTDQSLADTAASLVSNFAAESNDEDQSGDEAAAEVTRSFQFGDRQALILDEVGRLAAASTPSVGTGGKDTFPEPSALSQSLRGLAATAARSGRAFETIPGRRSGFRAFAATVTSRERRYVVVVVLSLHEQAEALEQVRHAFYAAVPFALLIASLGGYLIARRSLAPVIAMGARAERIGAANLNERLPEAGTRNELGRLARIFNELLARLDSSFEQQRRFMADASHELRTPVAIVCGESEVALSQSERTPEEYRESLAILHDEGRRLTRIVEDLFMLARADAGQYRPNFTNLYLDETVSDSVRAVRSLAARRCVELQYRHAGEELPMRGDEGLIRRMLLNLLDNALKYTAPGGRVSVEVGQEGGLRYAVRVTDTGTGIPAEAQPYIFERFYRVDKARSRTGEAGGGAGLGLSIASLIAELHGGRVVLECSGARGSTFLIDLPAFDAAPEAGLT